MPIDFSETLQNVLRTLQRKVQPKVWNPNETRSPAVARITDCTGCQWPSRSFKVNDFPVIWKGVCQFLLLINSKLGLISHHFRDKTTYSLKHYIENCAKPLQMESWLLLKAYRKSPTSYPMVPSPTPYDLPFSHNNIRLAYYSAL